MRLPTCEFASLRSLRKLNLSCNRLKAVPSALSALTTLEQLDMDDSIALRDAVGLSQLSRLCKLRVETRALFEPAALPNFQNLVNLTHLQMGCEGLRSLPPVMMPASLVHLNMNAGLGSLPPAMLTPCAMLTSLTLRGQFECLPVQYSLLPRLTALDLSNVGLVELPANFGDLQSLQQLDLRLNRIHGLPQSTSRLQSLQTCHLGCQSPKESNDVQRLRVLYGARLVQDVPRLPAVTFLDLGSDGFRSRSDEANFCPLGELPATLFSHATLTHLWSRSCGVLGIKIVGSGGRLQQLTLGGNRISHLPEEIGMLQSLVQLDLHSNSLVQLPASLGRLHALRVLNVARNQLCALPATVGDLTDLRALQVDQNRLTMLPGLHATSRLKVMVACDNQLQSVEAICNATSLAVLVLFKNAIRELPSEFTRLTQLIWLDLRSNSIATVHKAVVGMTLQCAECVRVDPGMEMLLVQNQSRLLRVRPRPAVSRTHAEARVFHEEDEAELREHTLLTWALFV